MAPAPEDLALTPSGLARALEGKRLLIFDFDGTVADTSPLHERAFNAALAPHGVTVAYDRIAGMRTKDAVALVLREHGLVVDPDEVDRVARTKQQEVRRLIAECLEPMPGVDAFLAWARTKYRLALCSSGSKTTVTRALEKLGYEGVFDPLVTSDDVVRAKPDPEGYRLVLSLAHVGPEEALVFEDARSGIEAARSAHCDVVGVIDPALREGLSGRDIWVPSWTVAMKAVSAVHGVVEAVSRNDASDDEARLDEADYEKACLIDANDDEACLSDANYDEACLCDEDGCEGSSRGPATKR